jgi:hypothetical protein
MLIKFYSIQINKISSDMNNDLPWDDETIERLNKHQKDNRLHPYTCPNIEGNCADIDRPLIATKDGWVCKCGKYTQNWHH